MNLNNPVTAFDVASYILITHTKNKAIPAQKMQKLVYYCQALCIARLDQSLFNEKILASSNGPTVKELYEQHHGNLYIGSDTKGNLNHFSLIQTDIIDDVFKLFGNKTAEELVEQTMNETPWKEARQKFKPGDKGAVEIGFDSLKEFYKNYF
jgi:uncharacterized phage-associated protein